MAIVELSTTAASGVALHYGSGSHAAPNKVSISAPISMRALTQHRVLKFCTPAADGPAVNWTWTARLLLVGMLSVTACTTLVNKPYGAATAGTRPCVWAPATAGADGRLSLGLLGLTFALPQGFTDRSTGAGDLAFRARYSNARGLLTIACEQPGLDGVGGADGEQVILHTIDSVKVIEIRSAEIRNLPAGLKAAELYVENGPWTFSAIMSAPETSLDQQWDAFVDSIHLTPHPD